MEIGEKAHAPYNFVPFSNRIMVRYQSPNELPPHDVWDPELKSGEIHVTLEAQTPVLVSDGRERNNARFFKGADGTYQIPGSTVRGLLRQTMQILGLGHIRVKEDMEDYQIFFRNVAGRSNSIGKALKDYYAGSVMKIRTERVNGKSISNPEAVCGGYLHRKAGAYYIQPTVSPVLRVSRKHKDVAQFEDLTAKSFPVSYRENGQTVLELSKEVHPEWRQGTMLCTGRPVGRVPNGLYLFPEEDLQAESIPISEADVLSYQADWENRKNVLKPKEFWALPREGEAKPVFFLRYEKHTYFGMTKMLRVGCRYPLSHGLPPRHREYTQQSELVLDYPHAMLGYAGENQAYRSRVSVGDFRLEGPGQVLPGIKTVLGGPKASFYPNYVAEGKNYNQEDFRLRGHKLYWHKEEAKADAPANGNERVATTLYPLDKGSVFHGVIRYRNLHPDELGLLLWCIRLDPGCFHGIGMGKPYGFGRVKATIRRLVEWDAEALYCPEGLAGAAGELSNPEDAVETYIRTYDRYVSAALNLKKPKKEPSLRGCPEIQDFFYLRSAIRIGEEVGYMAMSDFSMCSALPVVETERKNAAAAAQPEPEPTSMEDMCAALKNKYKGL